MHGFMNQNTVECMKIHGDANPSILVAVYVDDIPIAPSNTELMEKLKEKLKADEDIQGERYGTCSLPSWNGILAGYRKWINHHLSKKTHIKYLSMKY